MQKLRLLSRKSLSAQAPTHVMHRRPFRLQKVRKGSRVFDEIATLNHTYVVSSGVIMILRHGELVDLVEPGGLLDQNIWNDAVAIAHTDCTLSPQLLAA